jgi:hypothetical protein
MYLSWIDIINNMPFVAFWFIGSLLFGLTYAILSFYKDFIISWVRREDKEFQYKLINLFPYAKLITFFSIIVIVFWSSVMFIDQKYFILKSGFITFGIIYSLSLVKYYLIDGNKFDYFDDLIWIKNNLTKNKQGKIKSN